MEPLEEKRTETLKYWQKFTNNEYLANAAFYCEAQGFGRAYLKRKIEKGHLQTVVQKYFNDFPLHEECGRGLFIFGGHNTGKTIAVTSLAKNVVMIKNAYLLNSFSCKFFLYDDLVRSALNKNTSIEALKFLDVLVLDDVGNEIGLNSERKFSVYLLENILRSREMNGRITWITSNIDFNHLSSIYTSVIANIIKRNFKLVSSNIFGV